MDRLIKRFDAVPDADLMRCDHRGVAYQRKMGRGAIAYDKAYFDHYASLDGTPIAVSLNDGRRSFVERHISPGARILDVGVGSGAFLRAAHEAGFSVKGIDVNPVAIDWLKTSGWLATDDDEFDAVTFWDSLEHIEQPERLLNRVKKGAVCFVAVPVFSDLLKIRESKHYKPGEHLYYWTAQGFIDWMALYGFRFIASSGHEVDAGRESIGAFVFRRDLPDYRDFISAYTELHSQRHYGSSATELHLDLISSVVRANRPASILDFGCGRSDLVAHFYLDGRRTIARYDPAIPAFKEMPSGRFDMVLCCDVLEHIPMAFVDKILAQIKERSDLVVFTISIKLAKARLPDGSNAHCTILSRSEWESWLKDVFGAVTILETRAPHEVNVLAGKRGIVSRPYHPCLCGGEVFLDSYNPVKRPVEWFMRCRSCGKMSEPSSTERDAEHRWSNSFATRSAVKS